MSKIQVAPSILAFDFGYLAEESKRCEEAGADMIHIDIMDGHFVPNLTLGPKAVASINRATNLFLDVHVMIYNPYDYVERLVQSGADRITFHLEATEEIEETREYIKKCNIQAGLALCPDTSEALILKYIDVFDLILLMTVNPGFGGQKFVDKVLKKINLIRSLSEKIDIEVDGGINYVTASKCVENGANVLVSGTHLFNSKNMKEEIQKLKSL